MLFCPMASFMVQYRVSVWSPRGKAMQHIENTGLPAAHLNLCTTNVTTWLAFWGKKSFHRFLCAEHFDLVTGCFKKNSSHGHKCADWRSSADVSTRQLMCPHVSWCFWMFLTVSQRLWQTDCCEGQMWFTALSCVCVDVCAWMCVLSLWKDFYENLKVLTIKSNICWIYYTHKTCSHWTSFTPEGLESFVLTVDVVHELKPVWMCSDHNF